MKTQPDWHAKISQPVYEDIVEEYDVAVPMRDGVVLTVDVHRPDADEKLPALLAYQPWGKDHDAFGRRFPHQRRPSPLWDGALESGDTEYLVSRGYVHVVADARGTGKSGGDLAGVMGTATKGEGEDVYDTIEWIAEQPWCDGNVGMVGISYLAAAQVIGAAEQPPHLRAIFAEGGHFDPYRHAYHGGILWQMPRAALRGRGGDSGLAVGRPFSHTQRRLGQEAFEQAIEERLQDPDIRYHPNYHQLLKYPDIDPIWLDYILNPHHGWFWQGCGSLEERARKIAVPVRLGVQVGRGWQLDDTVRVFGELPGFKQLAIRPGPPMQERPFHEFHDEIVRWYDHWLKGNDTGLLDEPAITVEVEGVSEVMSLDTWPPPNVEWTNFYLRPGHRLSLDAEKLQEVHAPPDGYYQAPQHVSDQVGRVTYTTPAFEEAVDLIGPAALHLWAAIDTDDTNWIATLVRVSPDGSESIITSGWLKASHRELDEEKSTSWDPVHPHTRSVPVPAGEIICYPIQIYPVVSRIAAGDRLRLEIKSLEEPGAVNPMLPPESGHLNSARATSHKIYRDRDRQSHIVLPVIRH